MVGRKRIVNLRGRIDYSTRSVDLDVRFPELTTMPSRLIEYGYVACTVTSAPCVHTDVTVTLSFVWSRSVADARTRLIAAPDGSETERPTDAWRAPARTASVNVM